MSLAPNSTPAVATQQHVRIAVVDDHAFFRELMCRALSRHSNSYRVVADVGTAAAAAAACRDLKPDILVLDIHLPDGSGVAAVADIKRVSPRTRILLWTAYPSEDWINEASKSGADGFVEKTNTWDDFMVAVDRVSRGQRYFCSAGTSKSSRLPPQNTASVNLTRREGEILTLIVAGVTTKEIATQLFISVPTVEGHRANLMKKTGARNVASLVRFAITNGLVSE